MENTQLSTPANPEHEPMDVDYEEGSAPEETQSNGQENGMTISETEDVGDLAVQPSTDELTTQSLNAEIDTNEIACEISTDPNDLSTSATEEIAISEKVFEKKDSELKEDDLVEAFCHEEEKEITEVTSLDSMPKENEIEVNEGNVSKNNVDETNTEDKPESKESSTKENVIPDDGGDTNVAATIITEEDGDNEMNQNSSAGVDAPGDLKEHNDEFSSSTDNEKEPLIFGEAADENETMMMDNIATPETSIKQGLEEQEPEAEEAVDLELTEGKDDGELTEEADNGILMKEAVQGKLVEDVDGLTENKVYDELTEEAADGKLTEEAVDDELTEEKIDDEVTEAVDDELTEEKINGEVPEEAVDDELTEQKINGEVTEEAVDDELTEVAFDDELTEVKVDGEVIEKAVDDELTEKKGDGEVTEETADGDLMEETVDRELTEEAVDPELKEENVIAQAVEDSITQDVGLEPVTLTGASHEEDINSVLDSAGGDQTESDCGDTKALEKETAEPARKVENESVKQGEQQDEEDGTGSVADLSQSSETYFTADNLSDFSGLETVSPAPGSGKRQRKETAKV